MTRSLEPSEPGKKPSWDDRYFAAAPRRSRGFFAVAGFIMILFGTLLAIGGSIDKAGDAIARNRVILCSGLGLVVYGLDLIVRAIRPAKPGQTFAGFAGLVRLTLGALFSALLVGTGVFAVVRGDVTSGTFLSTVGVAGMFAMLYARARELAR